MCEEYERLLAVYKNAMKIYNTRAAAVGATSDLTDEEARRLIRYANEAKAAALVAAMELEDHCEEHECAEFREGAG